MLNAQPTRVLLIEDDPGEARLVREELLEAPCPGQPGAAFELVQVDRLEAGLARLAEGGVDIVLLDLSLPDSQGLDTFYRAQIEAPWLPIVVLTGLDDETCALQAVRAGAQDYLVKGAFGRSPLARAVRYSIERYRLQAQLRTLVLSDPLTGLNNRRGFFAFAEQQLKIATRLGQELLMICADVDGLKAINDSYGHPVGDRALQEAAAVLCETFRASDVIGRLGGDEFAAVVLAAPSHADSNAAAAMARLRHNLEARNLARGDSYQLTLSVGCARQTPRGPLTIEGLIARADALMYADRRSRRATASAD